MDDVIYAIEFDNGDPVDGERFVMCEDEADRNELFMDMMRDEGYKDRLAGDFMRPVKLLVYREEPNPIPLVAYEGHMRNILGEGRLQEKEDGLYFNARLTNEAFRDVLNQDHMRSVSLGVDHVVEAHLSFGFQPSKNANDDFQTKLFRE